MSNPEALPMPLAPRRPAPSPRNRGSRRLRPLAETLEGRALLSASIDVDSDGVLTYRRGGVNGFKVTITGSDGSYRIEADQPIDLLGDGGLDISGGGTTQVTAAGISRLVLESAGNIAEFWIGAVDVPTEVRAGADANMIVLGAWNSSAGLSTITAPIVVTAAPNVRNADLFLEDSGTTGPNEYTITADAVAATGGFAGVTFSGLTYLHLSGSSTGPGDGPSRFNIRGVADGLSVNVISRETAGGRSEFVVDAEEPATDAFLNLTNQKGEATFIVRKTATPTGIVAFGESVHVVVSDEGSTAGFRHRLDLVSVVWTPVDLIVDDSAGTSPRDATLSVWSSQPYQRDGLLTGAGGPGGEIRYTSAGVTGVAYKGARGRGGSFTVDLEGGESFPDMGDRTIAYDGGGYDGGAGGRLTIRGSLPEGPATTEVHSADAPGVGSLAFDFAGGASGVLEYSGLAPAGLTDLVPALNYRFEYRGPGDALARLADGPAPGTSTIVSGTISGAFTTTTIGNKAAVEGVSPALPPVLASPESTTTPPPTLPGGEPTPLPPPAVDPAPAAPVSPEAPSGGPIVTDARLARFGSAMRTSQDPRPTAWASSPFRRLREARLARLSELRRQRVERLHAHR